MQYGDPKELDLRDLLEDLDWIGVELDIPLSDLVEIITTARPKGGKGEDGCD